MQTTTSDYDTAVTATVRQSVATLAVDWDDDGDFTDAIDDVTRYVKSITVDRALTTDLPEQARLVTGYASTKLTAQLGGDPRDLSKTASAVWSPYSSGSDYYGKTRIGADVVAKLGLNTESGDELFTVFTGRTTKVDLSRGQATATLEALDGAEKLRGPVHLDQMVSVDPSITSFRPGLNSQAIIERILALGGFHAGPAPRDDAVLAATLHGTAYPQVGTLTKAGTFLSTSDDHDPLPYLQGKFGLGLTGPSKSAEVSSQVTWTLSDPLDVDTGAVMVEMWVTVVGTGGTLSFEVSNDGVGDDFRKFTLDFIERSTLTDDRVSFSTPTIPADSEPHYFAFYIEFGATSATIKSRVDTTDLTDTVTLPAVRATASTGDWTAFLDVDDTVIVSDIQITPGVQATVDWHNAFSPTAVLEPGLSELTAIPSTEADDAWALLQEIVGAEFGTLVFTGSGVATFRNRQHWRKNVTANTVQRTLTATDSILDLSTVELADQVRNRIKIPVTPLNILPTQVVWQQSDVVAVPAKDTLTLWAKPQNGQFYGVDTTGWVTPEGGGTGTAGDDKSGYRAARNQDGTGGQISNLTMTITVFADSAKIVFTNPNAFDAWLVSPHGGVSPNGGSTYPAVSDGKAAAQLVGKLITGQVTPLDGDTVDPSLGDAGSVAEAMLSGLTSDTERLYTAPSSPWRQSLDSAQSCADDLLRALHRPVPQVQNLSIVADPSLELGDRVQIKDESGTKLDDPFWIVGITTTYSATEGMTQSVTLRPVAAPGQFIFGVTGRDLVGTTPL